MNQFADYKKADKNQLLNGKEVWKQQWFLTKFCFKKAPGFMAYHLFESIKLQVSIFFEFTWAINYILNVAEAQGDFRKIFWCMVILMIAIAISTVTFAIYKQYILPKAKPVLYQALRMEIYDKAKELDIACYDDRDFYEHFILATQEADKCIDRYLDGVEFGIGRVCKLFMSLVYAIMLNPVVLVFVVLILPIDLLLVKKENKASILARMERVTHEQKREYGNRVFYLADYAKDLRLNPKMKKKCRMDYRESNEEIQKIHRHYGKRLFVYGVIRESILYEVILEGLMWTALLYQMLVLHTLSCADLITSRQCIYNLTTSSRVMVDEWRKASENAVYIYRIRELLAMESVIASHHKEVIQETGAKHMLCEESPVFLEKESSYLDNNGACSEKRGSHSDYSGTCLEKERLKTEEKGICFERKASYLDEIGDICIEHVDFAYPSGKQVLKDINLNIKAGQKIALVGYNGSGKTTLVKLLLRLYDPASGWICFAGKDIREFDVKEYRKSIGSVFQDFKIYAATLKENVLMDMSDGSKDENYQVEKALFDAHFTLEDNRLVYQTETPLTTEFEKDGVNLSGGESQKVAIARTLYRKQNIIIMDEPSSALDPLAEYRLNQELNEIAKDKTVIFISHRLSTTRDADCIYMMEDGRIIESGTHEQLLAKNGKYAKMWNVQAGLYAKENLA